MVTAYGLWPGVVAVANDADFHCIDCACEIYGHKGIMAVVDGTPGYQQYTDHEGNPFNVVLANSEDAKGQYCGDCGEPLSEEEEEESIEDAIWEDDPESEVGG